MDRTDLQKRRREDYPARDELKFGEFWYDAKHNPYLSIAAGIVVGVPSSGFSFLMFADGSGALAMAPLIPAAALVWRTVRQFRRWGKSSSAIPKLDKERELLGAILGSGGSITPVEAALETSLTVDEADEILSRFADRGHLLVESRDGALYYALPGKRSHGLEDRTAPGLT